jgi:hypothetical protein
MDSMQSELPCLQHPLTQLCTITKNYTLTSDTAVLAALTHACITTVISSQVIGSLRSQTHDSTRQIFLFGVPTKVEIGLPG